VPAAYFHDAVMTIGIGKPANLFRRFGDDLGLAKFVDELHTKSFTRRSKMRQ
jgi:hypothetical protein